MINLILMILISLWAVALCIGWWPRNERVELEPENSSPGRVIPPGVPITQAMKLAAGDLCEPQPPEPLGSDSARLPGMIHVLQEWKVPSPNFTLETFYSPFPAGWVRKFSVGQWVRHKTTGELRQIMIDGKRGWLSYRNRYGEAGWMDVDCVDLALPRVGEWWLKSSCPKDHTQHPKAGWSSVPLMWSYTSGCYTDLRVGVSKPMWDAFFAMEREACQCGCLAPVNFGDGCGSGNVIGMGGCGGSASQEKVT